MRKKLFAVIMSVMMMVTFMPAMAFAYSTDDVTSEPYKSVTWKDYQTATYKNASGNYKGDVVKYLEGDADGNWTGAIISRAYFDLNDDGDVDDASDFYAENKYYDLTNSHLCSIDGSTGDLSRFEDLDYDDVFGDGGFFDTTAKTLPVVVKFNVPKYVMDGNEDAEAYISGGAYFEVTNYTNPKKATALSDDYNLSSYVTLEVDVPKNDPEKQYVNQSLTIKPFKTPVTATASDYSTTVVGEVPGLNLTVLADEANINDARYIVDGDVDHKYIGNFSVAYDGAEHEVTQIELPGVTSSFELWNKEAQKYEAVDKLTFKNVGDYRVQVTVADKKNKEVRNFTITVEGSTVINYVFDKTFVAGISSYDAKFGGFYVGKNFNAKDFITLSPAAAANAYPGMDVKAAKKAFAADKEQLMALFDEICEITVTDSDYQAGIKTAKVEFKELTVAERKAIAEKYEELLDNYTMTTRTQQGSWWNPVYVSGTNNAPMINGSVTGTDTLNFQVKDSVNFTKAPLNKTFKAKNGKLAKKRTFNVKATAKSGAEVTYSIANGGSRIVINENTGKVTLKKGLKKRTYNVKITATAGSYLGTSKTVTVKIKVK